VADSNPAWVEALSEHEYALLAAIYACGEVLHASKAAGLEPSWTDSHGLIENAVLQFPLSSNGHLSVAAYAAASKAVAGNELWRMRAEIERQRREAQGEWSAARLAKPRCGRPGRRSVARPAAASRTGRISR